YKNNCTIIRCTPKQFRPTAPNAPATVLSTASSISASSKTIEGEFDPNSIAIFFNPAFFAIDSPVSSPPVNETILTDGCVTNTSPISLPFPVITDNTFSGNPAWSKASANNNALNGVNVAGFTIIAFPDAIAGPILWATKFNGSLNGVIAATMPIGK